MGIGKPAALLRRIGAALLLSTQRIDLAIQAMSGSANISLLSSELHVSRKFVYQQKDQARLALDNAFRGPLVFSAISDGSQTVSIR